MRLQKRSCIRYIRASYLYWNGQRVLSEKCPHSDKVQNIITRTPLRITLSGGGTDLDYFLRRDSGASITIGIDKSMYIHVTRTFEGDFKIKYSQIEEVEKIDDIKHARAREILRLLDIKEGVAISSSADVPAKGTGLASSSAYTVGLLNALHAWKGEIIPPMQLAKEAVHIEKDVLKEPCGLQDQHAVAFGGINLFEYRQDGSVKRNPVIMKQNEIQELQNHMMLLYTNIQRDSGGVLQSMQSDNSWEKFGALLVRKHMAYMHYDDLTSGNWQKTGYWLSEGHKLKRRIIDKASTSKIDELCDKVAELGGNVKNVGAGGGGFLLIFAPPSTQEIIRKQMDLRELKFKFDFNGSSIVFND